MPDIFDLIDMEETTSAKPQGEEAAGDIFDMVAADQPPQDPSWWEATGEAAVSAGTGIVSGIFGLAKASREAYKQGIEERNERQGITPSGPRSGLLGKIDRGFDAANQGTEQVLEETADYWGGVAQEYAPKYSGTFLENPSVKRGVSALVQGGVSLGVAVPVSIIAGPSGGAAILSGAEAGGIYEDAKAKGKTPKEALDFAMKAGTVTFMLEKFGLDSILKTTGPAARRFIVGAIGESGTEATQTIAQNAIAKHGYDEAAGYFDNIIESVIGGLVGGPAAVLSGNPTVATQEQAVQAPVEPAAEQGPITDESRLLPSPAVEVSPEGAAVTPEQKNTIINRGLNTGMTDEQVAASQQNINEPPIPQADPNRVSNLGVIAAKQGLRALPAPSRLALSAPESMQMPGAFPMRGPNAYDPKGSREDLQAPSITPEAVNIPVEAPNITAPVMSEAVQEGQIEPVNQLPVNQETIAESTAYDINSENQGEVVKESFTPQAPLQIAPLSEKAILVKGDTKAHKDRIKALKGSWNAKHGGWMFPKKRETQVREALQDLLEAPVEQVEQAPAGDAMERVELDPNRRAFIESKVQELGSLEAVQAQYAADAQVDNYAREYAQQVFGEQEAALAEDFDPFAEPTAEEIERTAAEADATDIERNAKNSETLVADGFKKNATVSANSLAHRWYIDGGYSAKETTAALRKHAQGKALTEKQQGIVEAWQENNRRIENAVTGNAFEESTYDPDWGVMERKLSDAFEAAKQVDEDAAFAIMEKEGTDAEILRRLIELSERETDGQSRTESADTQTEGQGNRVRPEEEGTTRPGQKVGEDGKLFATPPTFGKKPKPEGANVTELAMETEMAVAADDAKQTGMFEGGPADGLDRKRVAAAYSGTSNSPMRAADVELSQFDSFMQELEADLRKDLPEGNEQSLADELERVRAEYVDRRYRVLDVRKNTVSAHVAGKSNFNAKQAGQRNSALDRAEEAFAQWTKQAEAEAAAKTGVAEVREQRKQASDENKQKAREEADRREKSAKQQQNKLPIVNDPGLDFVAVTKEKWAKAPNDYKSILVSQDGTYRYRSMIVNGGLAPVYLTDSKTVPAPSAESSGYTVDNHKAIMSRMYDGELSVADLQSAFAQFMDSREALSKELGEKTVKELTKMLGSLGKDRARGERKAAIVKMVLGEMTSDFVAGQSYSYGMDGPEAAIRAKVDGMTEELLQAFAERVKEARAKNKEKVDLWKKSLENPETLDDFKRLVQVRGAKSLTAEQQARYDELRALANKEQRQAEQEAKAVVRGVELGDTGMEMVETTHTKNGYPLWVVKLTDKVDKDVYKDLLQKAKQLGGWYSSYRANGAVPGFQFKEQSSAESFMALKEGDVSKADRVQDRQESVKQNAAANLAEMAAALEEKANASLNQDRKTHTHRMARMAGSAEAAARADVAMAQTMRNLSAAIESGEATHLDGVRAKTHIEALDQALRAAKREYERANNISYAQSQEREVSLEDIQNAKYPYPSVHESHVRELFTFLERKSGGKQDAARLRKLWQATDKERTSVVSFATAENITLLERALSKAVANGLDAYAAQNIKEQLQAYGRWQKMGITDLPSLRAALREYLNYRGKKPAADRIKQLEREVSLKPIPGFFPTPKNIVQDMIELADLQEGLKVLEPSAGKGNIADAIREAGFTPEVVEYNSTLADLLQQKGYDVVGQDFLEQSGEYDRILMNPPFENGQDMAHVRHAYDLLKQDGKVVAIMSRGPFFRNDRQSTEFRQWIEDVGGEVQELPDGSFKSAERPTGVATSLVVINKDAPAFSRKPALFPHRGAGYLSPEGKGMADDKTSAPVTDQKRVEELTASLSRAAGREVEPASVDLWERTDLDDLGKLAGVFQKKIVVFQTTREDLSGLPGFFDPKLPGTIFVNVSTPVPHLTLFGHELTHAIKEDRPDLYEQFLEAVAVNEPHFQSMRQAVEDSYGVEITDAELMEEYAAEFIGGKLTDKSFWQKLYAKSPELFRAAFDAVKRIVQKIQGADYNLDIFFKNANKAESVAAEVLTEYAKGGKNTRFSRNTGTGLPLADLSAGLKDSLTKLPGALGKVNLVQSETQLPQDLQAAIEREQMNGAFDGVYWKGNVHLVADNLTSMEDAQRALIHETRHLGLEHVLGGNKKPVLAQAAMLFNKDVADYLKAHKIENTHASRLMAAEEVLVDMVRQNKAHKFIDSVIAKVREWVRSVFSNLELSKAELRNLIANVDKYITSGEEVTFVHGGEAMAFQRKDELKNKRGSFGGAAVKIAPHDGPANIQIIDGEAVLFADKVFLKDPDLVNSRILPRAVQRFLSPLDENVYVRTTNQKEDFNHLKNGTHRGSMNHANGETEYGLSVADKPEYPAKYAYFVTGEKIADGTDGEPIIDVGTARPVGKLRSFEDLREEFDALAYEKRESLGLSKEAVKSLNLATFDRSGVYEPTSYARKTTPARIAALQAKADAMPNSAEKTALLAKVQELRSEVDVEPPPQPAASPAEAPRAAVKPAAAKPAAKPQAPKVAPPARPVAMAISDVFDVPEQHTYLSALKGVFRKAKEVDRKESISAARTKLVDRMHPIEQLGQDAYMQHRLLGNAHATISTFLQHGRLSWDQGVLSVKEKGQGFLPWLHKIGADGRNLFYWIAVKRAEKLEAEGRENWLTPEKRQGVLDSVFAGLTAEQRAAKEKSFEQLNKEFQAYNQNIIDISMEAGLVSQQQVDAWMRDFYLPFYRIMEDPLSQDEFISSPQKSKKHISAQIKRLEGGTEKIGDPIENILRNWSHLIQESQRNVARATAAEVAVDMGLAERVAGNELFKSPGARKENSVISFQEDGKAVFLKVSDELLFEALAETNAKSFNSLVLKMLGAPKRWLTVGATISPSFRIANMLRDTLHTAVVSKSFAPFVDTGRGLVQVWKESPDYIALMASGGGFGQGWVDSGDPRAMARHINKIVKREGKGSKGTLLDTPRKMLEFWERTGHASEMAARVQLYTNLKVKGESNLKAAYEARDLLDFYRTGASNAVRVLSMVTPFLNARIQGMDRMYRGAKADPKAFLAKGALVSAASLLLWSLYHDDDRYKDLEDWEKWQYHHFWIGDQHFRIPKAFEVGALFSTLAESAAAVLTGDEEYDFFLRFLRHTLTETFSVGAPAAVAPSLEVYANKSAFTGRPLEGMSLQRLPAGERANPWTPEILKDMGRTLGVSPIKMEHMVQGHFAVLGSTLLGVADAAYRWGNESPSRPAKTINDLPGLGRFVRSEIGRTKYATRYYEFASEVNELAATISHYKQLGDYQQARKLAMSPPMRYRRFIDMVNSRLSLLRKQERLIYMDARMSAEEKRRRLDQLSLQRKEIYKFAYERIKL